MTTLEVSKGAKESLKLLAYLQHNKIEIPETGYNKFGSYKYPLLDDILEAIQPYLKEYNCIVLWSEDEHSHDRYDDEDDTYIFTDSLVTCRIQSVIDTNDFVQAKSHGAGLNKNMDKTLKAETIARRFSLMCLLGMQKLKAEDTDDDNVPPNRSSKSSSTAMSFKERMNQRKTSTKRQSTDKLM